MEISKQLKDLQDRKEALIIQQQKVNDGLMALRIEEQNVTRAARADGLRQMGEIAKLYKIPKHEVIALYSELKIDFRAGRPPKIAKSIEATAVKNPVLDGLTESQEIADRFIKLHDNEMFTELLDGAKNCDNLEQILSLLPANVECYIIENLN